MSYPSYASINLYPIEDPRNRSNHVIPTTIGIIQWILTNYNLYSLKIAFVSLVSKPKNTNSQRWSDPDFFVGFTTLVAGWWFGTWLLWLSIIYGMSSLPLTNSIIFQRGRLNHQPDITIISVILSNIIPISLSNYYHQPDSFAPSEIREVCSSGIRARFTRAGVEGLAWHSPSVGNRGNGDLRRGAWTTKSTSYHLVI